MYSNKIVLSGLIFPIMTAILYIIPLITRLLVNTEQKKKKKLHTVCLFTIYLLPFMVFSAEKYSSLNWRHLPRLKITIFSQNIEVNVKLIHTSGLGVHLIPIWSRLQISWHRLATENAGVLSDRTTCRAKILERRVIRNTWIRGRKATFLDNGQICLAAVCYTKIIDRWLLGRPIQVNGAFYSIKKRRVIIPDYGNLVGHYPLHICKKEKSEGGLK